MNSSQDNDFIYEAVAKLEMLAETVVELDSKRKDYDATVTIGEQRFHVIAKSVIRDSNIGIVLTPFIHQNEDEKGSVLLIAKYISKNSAQALRASRLNYLESSGNAYIKKAGLFICNKNYVENVNYNKN